MQSSNLLNQKIKKKILKKTFIISEFFHFWSNVLPRMMARKVVVVEPEAYFSLLCNEMIIDGSRCCCTSNTLHTSAPDQIQNIPLGSFLSPCLLPPSHILTHWSSWANYKTCTSSLIFFKGIRNGALVLLLTNHKMVGAQPYFPPYHNGQNENARNGQ